MGKHDEAFILWFDDIGIEDVPLVGGKNASLGEMHQKLTSKGVDVPNGFSITAYAYRHLLKTAGIGQAIEDALADLDTHDLRNLQARGEKARNIIRTADFPEDLRSAILESYKKMEEMYGPSVDVAVRSSATAEDLPDASFAGQQETYLNIRGPEQLIDSCRRCFASLFTDRAISYRHDKGFGQFDVYLSIVVQKMARSDSASSGVMFSIDTESGFEDAVFITGAWGLGETVVQGAVNPDEFYVFKPTLKQGKRPIVGKTIGSKEIKMIYDNDPNTEEPVKTINTTPEERGKYVINDDEILQLAKWACIIEDHYGKGMDIEWAKDGDGVNVGTGKLFIVQARPETVHSQASKGSIETYKLKEKGKVLVEGLAVGTKIGQGEANVIAAVIDIHSFKKGQVLVTDMTDPDWEPIMKIASAIVTNRGGRTCHAAIISRELGIPCVIGTGDGSKKITNGQNITVSSAEGEKGIVYEGLLNFEIDRLDLTNLPKTKTKIMMNLAIPEKAFSECQIPNDGVGLAREEFVINSHIGIHPLALFNYEELKKSSDPEKQAVVRVIDKKTTAYTDKKQFFIDKVAEGVGRIAAGFYPKDVIVRLSDFKSNEYANLTGGTFYEPHEENPMIGWRGASRYYDPKYRPAFELECKGLLKARNDMGLTNIKLMVPFCRTPEEGKKVIQVMKECGLVQGENGLELYVMCEIPSNVILADAFADIFDGFSIGSNDLTQLTYGLDRDSGLLAGVADERDAAVKEMIKMVIATAKRRGRKIGICGQGPSDFPEFATFLVECGIDSMSLIPDTVVKTRLAVAAKEKEMGITP
ncbi:MAG: phosphoenolpyruvate synthase [Desulfurivibrionaceae bacterium]|jgi:pyruvate,water dikinase|nr:phosphoenolpyruvate synthase [Pseudomonadota bacterium]MCG2824660.1 phosphoenolpyruvate synthase [Desulfobulbaceae bacterium]MDP2003049.1 phosphoenolpyruvate synthase [Desulfurivibrionaceae bacterium]MBU4229945.1 phosphoenolpyruvate synthase [Pseudomonadota bacterium]MBU4412769.1 phosphoenolpyruvate synthase [Pseudomonadota bacterium]